MKYYKDNENNVFAYESDGSQDHLIGDKVEMTAAEVEAHINPPKTPKQLFTILKAVKDKAVADKLVLHQYDSLDTLKMWEGNAIYGAEVEQIKQWYIDVTNMSIALENDVKAGTKPIPTEAEYQAMIDAVI